MKCFQSAFSAVFAAEWRRVATSAGVSWVKWSMVSFISSAASMKLESVRWITFTPVVGCFSDCTHSPNPARSVVMHGTWKAMLSSGVYPHGS